ncbi:hypothetical protein SXCC_02702 [Gluconacetobacter sp. SXCC-1]|nr:hypothetical protein SXCC_02702 [Gluconacetobacter sp. SXCC-1]
MDLMPRIVASYLAENRSEIPSLGQAVPPGHNISKQKVFT